MNNKKTNNRNHPENEWVIRLIDAARAAVKGYEKYLLDRIDYDDLAILMQELRDLLPDGCMNDDRKKN
mgnify:CR=1 FL=1